MTKYEYKVIKGNFINEDEIKLLNTTGESGWRLVSSVAYGGYVKHYFVKEEPEIDTRTFSDMENYLMDRESGQ